MDSILTYTYDIAAVIILLIFLARGAKNGFIKTVFRIVGYIASLILANALSRRIAEYVFVSYIRPQMYEKIEATLVDAFKLSITTPESAAAEVYEGLPGIFRGILSAGSDAVAKITQAINNFAQNAAAAITDDIVAPSVISLLTLVAFIVIFSALIWLVRIIAGAFKGVSRLPLIGPVNRLLGGLLGLVQGALLVYALVICACLISVLTNSSEGVFSQEAITSSYTYRLLAQVDYFDIFGLVRF